MKHEILLDTEWGGEFPYAGLLERCICAALEAEKVECRCEINVLITDDEGIRRINRDMREIDRPTDVLSFPMYEFRPGEPPGAEAPLDATGLLPLGDMAISYERARAQAAEYGHSVERELGYLAVHSVLHLLGYDHLDDGPQRAQMRAREDIIMDILALPRS